MYANDSLSVDPALGIRTKTLTLIIFHRPTITCFDFSMKHRVIVVRYHFLAFIALLADTQAEQKIIQKLRQTVT